MCEDFKPIEVQDDGKIIKMIETFEIQRRKQTLNDEEWEHYMCYATWEIADENIKYLRKYKGDWNYQLLRERTTVELTRLS